MRKEEKNLEQIISEIKSRNSFDYSDNNVGAEDLKEVKIFGIGRDYDFTKTTDILDALQSIVDVIGVIPAFGDALDAINAIVYALRGKYVDAVLSVVAIIPGFGSAIALPFKFALKAIPLNQAKKIAQLIVEGRGAEAAEFFAKHGDNPKVREFFKKFSKYGSDAIDVFAGPWLGILFKLLQRTKKFIPGKIDDKIIDEILIPAITKISKGLSSFFAGIAGKSAKNVTGKTIKLIPDKALMSRILTDKGRLKAPRLYRTLTSKRFFFIMQDRFVEHLHKKGMISNVPKNIVKELNEATYESLVKRGVKPTKEAVDREFTNLLILNHPDIFNKFMSEYKIQKSDFTKILGREYNKESAGRLRRLAKTGVKVSARGIMILQRPDEVERIEREEMEREQDRIERNRGNNSHSMTGKRREV